MRTCAFLMFRENFRWPGKMWEEVLYGVINISWPFRDIGRSLYFGNLGGCPKMGYTLKIDSHFTAEMMKNNLGLLSVKKPYKKTSSEVAIFGGSRLLSASQWASGNIEVTWSKKEWPPPGGCTTRAPKQKPVHHPHRNDGTVCLHAKSGPDGVHRQGKCQSRQLMENAPSGWFVLKKLCEKTLLKTNRGVTSDDFHSKYIQKVASTFW